MAIEIVDFPIENGGSFHSYVNVYQRVLYIYKYVYISLMVLTKISESYPVITCYNPLKMMGYPLVN